MLSTKECRDLISLRLASIGKNIECNEENKFSDDELDNAVKLSKLNLKMLFVNPPQDYDDLIIQGAVIHLLGGQALKECGREPAFSPRLADMILDQWKFEYNIYMTKINILMNLTEV